MTVNEPEPTVGIAVEQKKPIQEQLVVELEPPKEAVIGAIPEVKLAEIDRATCKVFVGDQIPSIDGFPQESKSKLTVLAFIAPGTKPITKMRASEIVDDLKRLKETNGDTVEIIVVQVGEAPVMEAETLKLISDPESKIYDQVATGSQPPRLLITDNKGKILWLDIEYSTSTRDELSKVVGFVIKNGTK
jgi:hypothetical protein